MSIAERYIFRIAFVAFLAALIGLTTVIWLTQALREFELGHVSTRPAHSRPRPGP